MQVNTRFRELSWDTSLWNQLDLRHYAYDRADPIAVALVQSRFGRLKHLWLPSMSKEIVGVLSGGPLSQSLEVLSVASIQPAKHLLTIAEHCTNLHVLNYPCNIHYDSFAILSTYVSTRLTGLFGVNLSGAFPLRYTARRQCEHQGTMATRLLFGGNIAVSTHEDIANMARLVPRAMRLELHGYRLSGDETFSMLCNFPTLHRLLCHTGTVSISYQTVEFISQSCRWLKELSVCLAVSVAAQIC